MDTLQKLLLVLVLLLIIKYLMCNYTKNNLESTPNNKMGNITDDTVLIIYAPWCGHCKRSMNDFKEASSKSDKIMLINSDDEESSDILKKYKVSGFPTIMKGSGEKYSGDRDSDSIIEFANGKQDSPSEE